MACVAYGCKSHSSEKCDESRDVSFHRVPKDQKRRDAWIQIIRLLRKETDWLPTTATIICSKHFKDRDKVPPNHDKGRNQLSDKAVPMVIDTKTSSSTTFTYKDHDKGGPETMPHCSVLWCKKTSKSSSVSTDGVSFHEFPRDPVLKRKWIEKTKRDENWFPTKYHRICSIHFNPKCITRTANGRRKLCEGSVPSLFIPSFVHDPPEASTSTAAAGETTTCLNAEESTLTSLLLDSDDEPTEQDAGDSEQHIHYTSSKESQNGRMRLSDGTGSAGSLLPETPAQSLQQELLMDLHDISDKIQNFYPTALHKQFTLTFKGEDGDKSEYVFTSASEARRSGEKHSGLRCNECSSDIIGFRYKCVSCEDYDLCSACEALGTHADHLMMRIAKPLKLKQARLLLQRWCEAMKTVGVTTTEEITGAPVPTEPDAGSAMLVGPIITKSKVFTATTPKDKVQTKVRTQPQKTRVEAKKRKMLEGESEKIKKKIDASAGDNTIEVPIKEEPLENTNLADYYSSFAETEPTVQVELVKVEDPDPLAADNLVKNEDVEYDKSLASPGRMALDTSLAPPDRITVYSTLAPPGPMAVNTSLAPSRQMAVNTSLAPLGQIAVDRSLTPSGPSESEGISFKTYTHKTAR